MALAFDPVKDWDTKFDEIVSSSTPFELEKILPNVKLDCKKKVTTSNLNFTKKVADTIESPDLLKSFLKHDTDGQLDVSCNYNLFLYWAILQDDNELIKKIIDHPNFSYPGTPGYSSIFSCKDDMTISYVSKTKCYDDHKDSFQFMLDNLNEVNRKKVKVGLYQNAVIEERFDIIP